MSIFVSLAGFDNEGTLWWLTQKGYGTRGFLDLFLGLGNVRSGELSCFLYNQTNVLDPTALLHLSAKYTAYGISNRQQRAQTIRDGIMCHYIKSKNSEKEEEQPNRLCLSQAWSTHCPK